MSHDLSPVTLNSPNKYGHFFHRQKIFQALSYHYFSPFFSMQHYDVSEASYSYGLGEELHNRVVGQSYSRAFCVNSPTLCCKTCLSMKSYTAPFLGKTYLHKFVGKHEIKLAMEPGTVVIAMLSPY